MNRFALFTLALVALFIAAACSPQEASSAAATPTAAALVGDASHGETLFRRGKDDAPPCITCHQISEGGFGFVLGPNLQGIGERAATRVDGLSADAYITESILSPDSFVVPGYRDLMFSRFGEYFSEQDVADILAFLRSL